MNKELLPAIQEGDLKRVQELIKTATDITAKCLSRGLHLAASRGHIAICQLLIDAGANLDNESYLNMAAQRGHEEICQLLLDHGARIGNSIFYWAVFGGGKIVDLFLSRGIPIDIKDERGRTALHSAVINSEVSKKCKLLVDRGAKINEKDQEGNTPLLVAADNNQFETIKLLLANGANIRDRDNYGRTAIHLAAGEGYEDTVKFLLESGLKIDERDNEGNTPLLSAAFGAYRILKFLVEQGANMDERDNKGNTPLHVADISFSVDALLELGAYIDLKNNAGDKPSQTVTVDGRLQLCTAEYLLALSQSTIPMTQEGLKEDLSFFPKFHTLNARLAETGNTALHNAVLNDNALLVEALLEHGASLYITNREGKTPLDVARTVAGEKNKNYFFVLCTLYDLNNKLEILKDKIKSIEQEDVKNDTSQDMDLDSKESKESKESKDVKEIKESSEATKSKEINEVQLSIKDLKETIDSLLPLIETLSISEKSNCATRLGIILGDADLPPPLFNPVAAFRLLNLCNQDTNQDINDDLYKKAHSVKLRLIIGGHILCQIDKKNKVLKVIRGSAGLGRGAEEEDIEHRHFRLRAEIWYALNKGEHSDFEVNIGWLIAQYLELDPKDFEKGIRCHPELLLTLAGLLKKSPQKKELLREKYQLLQEHNEIQIVQSVEKQKMKEYYEKVLKEIEQQVASLSQPIQMSTLIPVSESSLSSPLSQPPQLSLGVTIPASPTDGPALDVVDSDGNTPLHLAAKKNSVHEVKSLLKRGVSIDVRNKQNRLAKDLTTHPKIKILLEAAEYLINGGVDEDSIEKDLAILILQSHINARSFSTKETILHRFDTRDVRLYQLNKLLESGADIHFRNSQGKSAFEIEQSDFNQEQQNYPREYNVCTNSLFYFNTYFIIDAVKRLKVINKPSSAEQFVPKEGKEPKESKEMKDINEAVQIEKEKIILKVKEIIKETKDLFEKIRKRYHEKDEDFEFSLLEVFARAGLILVDPKLPFFDPKTAYALLKCAIKEKKKKDNKEDDDENKAFKIGDDVFQIEDEIDDETLEEDKSLIHGNKALFKEAHLMMYQLIANNCIGADSLVDDGDMILDDQDRDVQEVQEQQEKLERQALLHLLYSGDKATAVDVRECLAKFIGLPDAALLNDVEGSNPKSLMAIIEALKRENILEIKTWCENEQALMQQQINEMKAQYEKAIVEAQQRVKSTKDATPVLVGLGSLSVATQTNAVPMDTSEDSPSVPLVHSQQAPRVGVKRSGSPLPLSDDNVSVTVNGIGKPSSPKRAKSG